MNSFLSWLQHAKVAVYVAMTAAFIFVIFFKRLNGNERWVAAVILLYTSVDLVASVMSFLQLPNHWLYNVMLIPQFILVSVTLHCNMNGSKFKQVFRTGVLLLLILHVVNIMLFQGFSHFANFTYIPACAWMATGCFFYLREQMEQVDKSPFDFLVTWFALATLIDNAGTLPILSVLGWTNYIESSYALHLWDFAKWLYACWYMIIIFGLLWTKTSLRSVLLSR